jgi:hypothetical protein
MKIGPSLCRIISVPITKGYPESLGNSPDTSGLKPEHSGLKPEDSGFISIPHSKDFVDDSLLDFPPVTTKLLGNTTHFGAIGGVLWHPNSELIVISVHIAAHELCCDIYFCVAIG